MEKTMATDKPVTVTELKTFIDAVEFAADTENWIPSDRQWKRIRSMIERLEETIPQVQQRNDPPQLMHLPMPTMPSMMPPALPQMPPSMMSTQLPQGPFAHDNPGAPVRTPSIDTSNGSYNSSFA